MARCGCDSPSACGCSLSVGDGLDLTGTGTVADPWALSVDINTGRGLGILSTELVTTVTSGGGLRHNPSTGALEFDPVAYTAYTPSWWVGGVAWTPNATIAAAYMRVGRMIHARGRLTWTASTTFGALTGAIAVSLPVTAAAFYVNFDLLGEGNALDSGTAAYSRHAYFSPTLGNSAVTLITEAGVTVAHNTPIAAWATGDQFGWNVIYEAVS